jgi:RHS repeat-associated protein
MDRCIKAVVNFSNQLATVAATGFTTRNYAYDGNGNATTDGGSLAIAYNLLNLPQTVKLASTTKATYTYDATGQKLHATQTGSDRDYIDGIVYNNNAIEYISTEEGRVTPNGATAYTYTYDLKDHLGNVRVTVDKNPTGGAARVVQEDEYYAFGLRVNQYDFSNGNLNLYNGKELQADLQNQYDYGARFYDPVVGRWTTVDPLAEKMRRHSPYNYGFDNPMRFTDPDGNGPEDPPTFLQSLLRFFGIGKTDSQPRNAEQAQQQAQSRGSFFSKSQVLAANIDNLKEKADWVPFVGAASRVTSGKMNHDAKEAGLGIGMGLIDAVGGKLLTRGSKAIIGAGKEVLEKVIGKPGNIGGHLTEKDVTGAIRDIFSDPVLKKDGTPFDHLKEVNDALKGIGNQIEKLNKEISSGTFSDDVLNQAEKLRTTLQNEKDRIQNILNKAKKAANE